ncbi:MAG: PIG-L family deacetylase [Phycisphaerales bacterium]|nr:PIG-L family deacetylase [Phycisphaerales bacterium]
MANIVVIAPHPDDAEIGMGATIAKLAAQGHDVLICDLTDGCPTPIGDRPTRIREADAALKALAPAQGAGRVRRIMLDLPNRRVQHTIEARHVVAGVYRAHRADVGFVPHGLDAHPDHLAATRIAEDARFDAKLSGLATPTPPGMQDGPARYPRWLFYYYCSHLRRVPDPTFLIDVTGFEGAKRASLEAYHSQFTANPANAGLVERVMAGLTYFGSRAGTAAAEPFFAHEPITLGSLASVVGL